MAEVHEERFIPPRQKLDQLSVVKDYATVPRLEYRYVRRSIFRVLGIIGISWLLVGGNDSARIRYYIFHSSESSRYQCGWKDIFVIYRIALLNTPTSLGNTTANDLSHTRRKISPDLFFF
jgi:hypothetical protein